MNSRYKIVKLCFSTNDYELIKKEAEVSRQTVSQLIRAALFKYLGVLQ